MAVVKSDTVTIATSGDGIQNESGVKGFEVVQPATYAAPGVIADNDVILMMEIPVDAKITSIRAWVDDLGATGDLNLGFYPGPSALNVTIASDSDAVDEDCLATALDVNAAALADVELRFEVQDINTVQERAWEIAGLSAKPEYSTFYLAFTASEATTAAGDITLIVRHTQN